MLHFLFLILILILLSTTLHTVVSGHCTTSTAAKTFKKCMALPSQGASIAWTFHPHNATLDLVFFGSFISPSGWVAWGINPTSPEMTGTRALFAFPDPNSGQLLLLPYMLNPTVKLQTHPLLSGPLDLHLISSSATLYGGRMATIYNGANVQIYATLKLVPNRSKVHYIWNRGLYVQGYSPTIHPTTINDLSSISTVDLMSSTSTDESKNTKTLKIVHGLINGLSWGVLLPIGAVTARYLRQIQSLDHAWFYVHAIIQLTVFSLGMAGFVIGIQLGEMSPGRVYGLHRKLGMTTFCLGSLQTLALLFRPKTRNKFRKYWKSYHHFVGYACVLLGVVNVFQGFEVMGEGRSFAKLWYCLGLSTVIGICIALEVNAWVMFCRKSSGEELKVLSEKASTQAMVT